MLILFRSTAGTKPTKLRVFVKFCRCVYILFVLCEFSTQSYTSNTSVALVSPATGHCWGTCPLDFPLFNSSGQFRAAQTLTFDSMQFPTWKKKMLAYSFVTVYCMNFIIFLCITLKLFAFSFVPLLAPNPGDATESVVYSCLLCGVSHYLCWSL